jgi:hypothetical protein
VRRGHAHQTTKINIPSPSRQARGEGTQGWVPNTINRINTTEEKTEIRRFVRAILKNAGANQLPTKLIKQSVNTATNQAETPVSVPKCRNQSSRIKKKT